MSDDLKEIKQRILDDNQIKHILDSLECQHVARRSNRYEAQLPVEYDSPNTRAVQVKITVHLDSYVRNMDAPRMDIFGLVSFIKNKKRTKEEIDLDLFESKKWVCNLLGYHEFLQRRKGFPEKKKEDPLLWLKEMRKQRKRFSSFSNPILDDFIVDEYVLFPSEHFYNEGISIETQIKFEVGLDVFSQRIIFPIHNKDGELIGVKGRTINENYEDTRTAKFLYLYPCNKSLEFYNWHRALSHILDKKEVIIFEAEKSCWFADQYGYPNSIAIGGSDITNDQIKLLSSLGVEVKIVLAYDKDKLEEDVLFQAKKFSKSRLLYAIYDYDDVLQYKNSPVDLGKEVFDGLYKQYLDNRIYL